MFTIKQALVSRQPIYALLGALLLSTALPERGDAARILTGARAGGIPCVGPVQEDINVVASGNLSSAAGCTFQVGSGAANASAQVFDGDMRLFVEAGKNQSLTARSVSADATASIQDRFTVNGLADGFLAIEYDFSGFSRVRGGALTVDLRLDGEGRVFFDSIVGIEAKGYNQTYRTIIPVSQSIANSFAFLRVGTNCSGLGLCNMLGDFRSTLGIGDIDAFDVDMNEVTEFSLQTSTGFSYPLSREPDRVAIPLPATAALIAGGLAALIAGTSLTGRSSGRRRSAN